MHKHPSYRRSYLHNRDSKGNQMKVQIIIDTVKEGENLFTGTNRSKVWEGELEIIDEKEYLVLITIMGEGMPQPIVQLPFAKGIGHYIWIPPDTEVRDSLGEIGIGE